MKVFFIGEPKTGTKSIAKALDMLGVRTFHSSKSSQKAYNIETSFSERSAFLDGFIRHSYVNLDKLFEDKKFVYTEFPPKQWVKNVINHHVRKNREITSEDVISKLLDTCRRKKEIFTYFGSRSDFRIINLTDSNNNWETLIDILELDSDIDTSKPFPKRGGSKKYKSFGEVLEDFNFTENYIDNILIEEGYYDI